MLTGPRYVKSPSVKMLERLELEAYRRAHPTIPEAAVVPTKHRDVEVGQIHLDTWKRGYFRDHCRAFGKDRGKNWPGPAECRAESLCRSGRTRWWIVCRCPDLRGICRVVWDKLRRARR